MSRPIAMSAPAATNCTLGCSCKNTMATIAPTNGAREKYAPVRAVPTWRNANMKKTKLTPMLKKPTSEAASTKLKLGMSEPRLKAKTTLTRPATAHL